MHPIIVVEAYLASVALVALIAGLCMRKPSNIIYNEESMHRIGIIDPNLVTDGGHVVFYLISFFYALWFVCLLPVLI